MLHPLANELNHILSHTLSLWEDLRGAHLFITGGTGFFGKWLLESLAWANDQLSLNAQATVLTRSPGSFQEQMPHLAKRSDLRFWQGDIQTFTFPPEHFSHVIHAATPTVSGSYVDQLESMSDLIIQGTRRVLEFARRFGPIRVLFTSSGAVYGRQPPELTHIPESYAGAPNHLDRQSVYGEGKRASEHLCALAHYQHGLVVSIARCFAFVGPYLPLDAHFAIGNFIRDGLHGQPIRV